MSIQSVIKFALCLALGSALAVVCAQAPPQAADSQAQDQTKTQPSPADQSKQSSDKQKNPSIQELPDGKVAGTSNDRLFYTLPNFLTLERTKQLPPMTSKDKFKVVALGTFDYVEYPWWGLLASINQASNSEPAFGQGWEAYAKRYGTTAGDSMVENFMVGAVYPSVLHQDPRFYQSGQGGFWKRSGYAVSRIFVTRGDSGHAQFNASEIFGGATAAAISTFTYHPRSTYLSTPTNPHLFVPSERTLSNAASVWETQIALDTFTIFVKEFWPDIHRKMSKKSNTANAAADSH